MLHPHEITTEVGDFEVMIDAETIQSRNKKLAARINADYAGKRPVFIGVLNGSFIFFSDILRLINIDCEVDFIKISSYGQAMTSSGTVKIKKDLDCEIEGRNVIIVEDIVDSGRSVQFLKSRLTALKPESLKFVSLLVKEGAAVVDYSVDYIGFSIPNRFVIGYGLDYAQKYRNLPAIYVLK